MQSKFANDSSPALPRGYRELDQTYGLTAEQKKKLRVAGNRDIHRFFDAVQEKKKLLDRAREDRLQFIAIFRDLRSFQVQAREENLFGDASLFGKNLRKTLSCEQVAGRAIDVYRARVESVVSSLDERLGLSPEQHRRLVTVILEETPALQRYGEYDTHAVLFQASRLPEAHLKRILDEGQLRLLSEKFLLARAYEKVLDAKGYLVREDPHTSPTAVVEGAKKAVGVRIDPRRPIRSGFTGPD